MKMKISVQKGVYAVCKLKNLPHLPQGGFVTLTVTGEEISLVCEQGAIPADATEVQNDFSLLKVEGPLDFSLIGILAQLSGILAKEGISIFCVSTYDTDYIMVREKELERAKAALEKGGYALC